MSDGAHPGPDPANAARESGRRGPTLVVGGTGMLGSQVVSELMRRGKQVRALVRPGSDAARLEAAGADIARGDMMDPDSLNRAMAGVDAVVTSAAGYTRHRKGDSPEIDRVGNSNLAEAAAREGVRTPPAWKGSGSTSAGTGPWGCRPLPISRGGLPAGRSRSVRCPRPS